MIKSKLLATAFAVAALSFTSAQGNDAPAGMEVCPINGKEIMLPAGQCAEVTKGNLSGLTPELKREVEDAKKSH